MLAFLAGPALAATLVAARPHCALTRLDACVDTNELVWDGPFRSAVRRFVGARRASYLYRNGRVSRQILDVLAGPPDEPRRIGDLYRFTACREHSCDELGAAVLEPNGRLVALAILHSDCALPNAVHDCYADNTLTIFIRDPARWQPVIADLSAWAASEIETWNRHPILEMDRFRGTEVIRVP